MQAVLMMTSETARADGVADEATIDARGLPYRALNEQIAACAEGGARHIRVRGVLGQRYLGTSLQREVRLSVEGIPGQDLGAFMDGPEIEVFGHAQDGCGNTMNGEYRHPRLHESRCAALASWCATTSATGVSHERVRGGRPDRHRRHGAAFPRRVHGRGHADVLGRRLGGEAHRGTSARDARRRDLHPRPGDPTIPAEVGGRADGRGPGSCSGVIMPRSA